MLEKIFRGFSKPADEDLQTKGFAHLIKTIGQSDEMRKFLGTIKNKMVVMRTREVGDDWEVLTGDMRWDLLNPGRPYLVPIEVVLTDKRVPLTDLMNTMIWCVYNMQTEQLTSVFPAEEEGEVKMVSVDVTTEEIHETVMATADAMDRFHQYCAYRLMESVVTEGGKAPDAATLEITLETVKAIAAEGLSIDTKTLALI